MIENNLPQWRQELKSSQKKEGRSPLSRWIQIATISKNMQPRVRTVVFRGWLNNNSMIIYTDKRSEKIKDLKTNNDVEILWLFLKSKSQFRLKGTIHVINDNDIYWNKLSKKSKSTWFWPEPGKSLDYESIKYLDKTFKKPNNFSVLELRINSVDLLKLENPIHTRYMWREENLWECTRLNP
tara:strand:+ start:116 stop:661 length:546 start_codon:yes stop_codon:yes gene_type:complete